MEVLKFNLPQMEEKVLEMMIQMGFFSNKDEAVRTAVIKYAMDLGLLKPEEIWKEIENYKRRKITPEQLMKDLEAIENETQNFLRH